MCAVYWFNPENDLALAANVANYTPARAGLSLRRAGALLPTLWAGQNDKVLVVDSCDSHNSKVVSSLDADDEPQPWGWSAYAAHVFKRHGAVQLPGKEWLERMRMLSHRATASQLLQAIDYDPSLIPAVAYTECDAIKAVARYGSDAVVKLPWSCSGRGVFYTKGLDEANIRQRVEAMLRRQGSVTVEPRYNRLLDFAALFYLEGGECHYRGLSMFATDGNGHYIGNRIASQNELRAGLNVEIDNAVIAISKVLPQLLDNYNGWVGIDMLSYANEKGDSVLAPCIEVNLRMTMGVAALLIAESGVLSWSESLLRVALPSEVLSSDDIILSATSSPIGKPLVEPCMVVSGV